MGEKIYRVLFVCTHPVQYAAPLFRRMAEESVLDVTVAYCSLQGAEPGLDAGFGVEVMWDVPLLEGYSWVQVQNRSPRPGLGRFWGLVNSGLWRLIRHGAFDAIVVYTGYNCASFWIAAGAAKMNRAALLFGTDAHEISPVGQSSWKSKLKALLWPRLFALADMVIVPSSQSMSLMRSIGVPAERIELTPYVVDNGWWLERAALVDRVAVRAGWGVPQSAPVVLFCGKLQPRKRPSDVLGAFAKARDKGGYLVYAGDGPLRSELDMAARTLGMVERVRLLGFVNQSQLPDVYGAADLLVVPSEHEPFGLVVNEAMLCGCAVAVSDRVGAGYDLVRSGQNGFVFPWGDVDALAEILRENLSRPERLRRMGRAGRTRLETWSPQENIASLVRAVEQALARRSPGGVPLDVENREQRPSGS